MWNSIGHKNFLLQFLYIKISSLASNLLKIHVGQNSFYNSYASFPGQAEHQCDDTTEMNQGKLAFWVIHNWSNMRWKLWTLTALVYSLAIYYLLRRHGENEIRKALQIWLQINYCFHRSKLTLSQKSQAHLSCAMANLLRHGFCTPPSNMVELIASKNQLCFHRQLVICKKFFLYITNDSWESIKIANYLIDTSTSYCTFIFRLFDFNIYA